MRGAQISPRPSSDVRELVEQFPLPAALNACDEAGSVLLVNDAFVQTFGYTLADIPTVGDWAVRAYPDAEYRRKTFAAWDAAIAKTRAETGRVEAMEFRVTCKDGTVRDVVIGAALTGDHLLVTFVDISARRRAERAIQTMQRQREHTAHELTARIPIGTYVIANDGDGNPQFTFVSERWLQMLDLRRDDVLADASLAFRSVHCDDQADFVRLSTEAMADSRAFSWEGRIVVRSATRWVSIESKPRRRLEGGPIWEGVMIDITARKEAETALATTHQMERIQEETHRRDLERKLRASLTAAAAAHEIKQPLGRILLETQLAIERLRAAPLQHEAMKDYLDNMLAESRHVVEMIALMRASLRGVQLSTPAQES